MGQHLDVDVYNSFNSKLIDVIRHSVRPVLDRLAVAVPGKKTRKGKEAIDVTYEKERGINEV